MWSEVAHGQPWHAVLVDWPRSPGEAALHTHNFWEVFWVTEGKAAHWINGQIEELQIGDLVLIRPSDIHCYRVAPRSPFSFFNIAFPCRAWEGFAGGFLEAGRRTALEESEKPLLTTLRPASLENMKDRGEKFVRSSPQVAGALPLAPLLATVVEALLPTVSQAPLVGPHWLQECLAELETPKGLGEGLPLLLRISGVTPSHLSRVFREATGQSPTGYILEKRLLRATSLLAGSTCSVGEIALECGFENLSYFHRAFRARFGLPPREFRIREAQRIAP
jgi:AraC family cel operon transcriptional repressor